MPGAPIMHGYPTSTGYGNAQRAANAAPLAATFPQNLSFFIWLVILGVVVPAFIIGGLKVGGFQFVFKGR